MSTIKRFWQKLLSIIGAVIILLVSVGAWYFIEIGFKGCCGASYHHQNDSLASLVHLVAYVAGGVLVWLSLKWGWVNKPTKAAHLLAFLIISFILLVAVFFLMPGLV